MTAERPWSVAVRLDEIPESGRHLVLEAGEEIRTALAKPAGVDAVERLVAIFDLTRRGRDALHVGGRIKATVRQTCVVTLEPVINQVDEAVDVDYVPPREPANRHDDIEVEVSTAAEVEPLVGNSVDLGLLATEFLILGVDPHPRREGVAFEAPATAQDPAAHPFAALAAWNKKGTVKK